MAPTLEHKAVPVNGVEIIDDENGIVSAIVSVTGIVDRVKDVILPGGYTKTLKARTPKGIWHHDWKTPVSRTLEVKELMPGDPNLPSHLPDGRPWPAQAGALKVVTQFNLETTRGREAFSDVKFFGDEQEWSIGYRVPTGQAKTKAGIRFCQEIDLYEYSPVLFGAMPAARTITSFKDAQETWNELKDDLFGACDDGDGTCCLSCGEKVDLDDLDTKDDHEHDAERFVIDFGDSPPEGVPSLVGSFATKSAADVWARTFAANSPDAEFEATILPLDEVKGDDASDDEDGFDEFMAAFLLLIDDDDEETEEKGLFREALHKRGSNGRFVAKLGEVAQDVADTRADFQRRRDPKTRFEAGRSSYKRSQKRAFGIEERVAKVQGRRPSRKVSDFAALTWSMRHLPPSDRKEFGKSLGVDQADLQRSAAKAIANGNEKWEGKLNKAFSALSSALAAKEPAKLNIDPEVTRIFDTVTRPSTSKNVGSAFLAATPMGPGTRGPGGKATGGSAPRPSAPPADPAPVRPTPPPSGDSGGGELTIDEILDVIEAQKRKEPVPVSRKSLDAAMDVPEDDDEEEAFEAFYTRLIEGLLAGLDNDDADAEEKAVYADLDDLDEKAVWSESRVRRDPFGRFSAAAAGAFEFAERINSAKKQSEPIRFAAARRSYSAAKPRATAMERILARSQRRLPNYQVAEMGAAMWGARHLDRDNGERARFIEEIGFSPDYTAPKVAEAVGNGHNRRTRYLARALPALMESYFAVPVKRPNDFSSAGYVDTTAHTVMTARYPEGGPVKSDEADLEAKADEEPNPADADGDGEVSADEELAYDTLILTDAVEGALTDLGVDIDDPKVEAVLKANIDRAAASFELAQATAETDEEPTDEEVEGKAWDQIDMLLDTLTPEEKFEEIELEFKGDDEDYDPKHEPSGDDVEDFIDDLLDDLFGADLDGDPEATEEKRAPFNADLHPRGADGKFATRGGGGIGAKLNRGLRTYNRAASYANKIIPGRRKLSIRAFSKAQKRTWRRERMLAKAQKRRPSRQLAKLEAAMYGSSVLPANERKQYLDDIGMNLNDIRRSVRRDFRTNGASPRVQARVERNLPQMIDLYFRTEAGATVKADEVELELKAIDEMIADWDEEHVFNLMAKLDPAELEELIGAVELKAFWNSSKHPRIPKGTPGGGRFMSVQDVVDDLKDGPVGRFSSVRPANRRSFKDPVTGVVERPATYEVEAGGKILGRTETWSRDGVLRTAAFDANGGDLGDFVGDDQDVQARDAILHDALDDAPKGFEPEEFKAAPIAEATGGRVGEPGKGNKGNIKPIMRWFERGEGAAKIRWGTSGDFMRCVHLAEKHMDPLRARGFCNKRHTAVTGSAPGKGHGDGVKKAVKRGVKDDGTFDIETKCILCTGDLVDDQCTSCQADWTDQKGLRRFVESMVHRDGGGQFAPKGTSAFKGKGKKKTTVERRAAKGVAKAVARNPKATVAAAAGFAAGRRSKKGGGSGAPGAGGAPGGSSIKGRGKSDSWVDTIDALADMAGDPQSLLNHMIDKGIAKKQKDGYLVDWQGQIGGMQARMHGLFDPDKIKLALPGARKLGELGSGETGSQRALPEAVDFDLDAGTIKMGDQGFQLDEGERVAKIISNTGGEAAGGAPPNPDAPGVMQTGKPKIDMDISPTDLAADPEALDEQLRAVGALVDSPSTATPALQKRFKDLMHQNDINSAIDGGGVNVSTMPDDFLDRELRLVGERIDSLPPDKVAQGVWDRFKELRDEQSNRVGKGEKSIEVTAEELAAMRIPDLEL